MLKLLLILFSNCCACFMNFELNSWCLKTFSATNDLSTFYLSSFSQWSKTNLHSLNNTPLRTTCLWNWITHSSRSFFRRKFKAFALEAAMCFLPSAANIQTFDWCSAGRHWCQYVICLALSDKMIYHHRD